MEVIVEIKYKGRTLLEGAFGYYYKRDVYIPLKELLKKFDSSITYSADLKKKNWFNIGGKAKVFLKLMN